MSNLAVSVLNSIRMVAAKFNNRYGQGKSKSAERRRTRSRYAALHAGIPGQIITMSDGLKYKVFPDGSFRRMDRLGVI